MMEELSQSTNPAKGLTGLRVKLGEICEIQLGKMLSPKSRTGLRPVPYLRNANVQWDRFDLSDVAQMDFDEREEAKFLLRPGDLLVCEGGEPGRAAVWDGQISPCCYQKALHRLRPINSMVEPHFLKYRLWLGATRGEFLDSNAKTTIAHLPAIRLAELPIILPTVEEQQRIASNLTEQMAALEMARGAVHAQLDAARALRVAMVNAIFERDEARRWSEIPLAGICVDKGTYGTSSGASTDTTGIPVIRMGNISDGHVKWDDVKYMNLSKSELLKYELLPGDILFNRTNSAELVGKSAVYDGSRRAVFASYLIRFRLRDLDADPYFVCGYINSTPGRAFIEANMTRAIGQVNISASTMGRMPIPLPPLTQQREIVKRLDRELADNENLQQSLKARIEAMAHLPSSILSEAFGAGRR